ncbi:ribonuclease VapC [Candidatus Bathyarchaeota archaeon]|nr:ribonuclease VapC [Candidatus Bathyarchaeota archaeon]RJS79098.1 MAG: ribonuclease VapC [Candidatus Bathyarchaeota archaeon]
MKVKRVIVLDTSAFLAGFDPFSVKEEEYTVPSVGKEMSERSIAWVRFKTAVENGKLKVKKPEPIFLMEAEKASKNVGDKFFLSKADLQVLALAKELKAHGYSPVIATDDYSIQNVADSMEIKFVSLATFGIRFRLKWIRYCPACHKKYPPDYKYETCEVCGAKLKRKALKKKSVI